MDEVLPIDDTTAAKAHEMLDTGLDTLQGLIPQEEAPSTEQGELEVEIIPNRAAFYATQAALGYAVTKHPFGAAVGLGVGYLSEQKQGAELVQKAADLLAMPGRYVAQWLGKLKA